MLQIVVCYNRLRANPALDLPPRTFLFAGKAAPAYRLAKLIIKLINDVGSVVNDDPDVRGKLRVEFLPNYSVTLAERLIPASDVSEQISTAGYEASGTSNMKFMMNGALTVGTRDGATIEIAEEVGEENVFLFGLTAEQVAGSRGWYDPRWHYEHENETREALDLIFSGHFNRGQPDLYDPIRDVLLTRGDHYMHLADLASYAAPQARVSDLYADRDEWARKAILNVACSGKFSSDRTIAEYAGIDLGGGPMSFRLTETFPAQARESRLRDTEEPYRRGPRAPLIGRGRFRGGRELSGSHVGERSADDRSKDPRTYDRMELLPYAPNCFGVRRHRKPIEPEVASVDPTEAS